MEEYNEKRASPLTQYTFNEISINLSAWRDILREELETLIYIKNCLSLNADNSSGVDLSQEQKIRNLIPKLEALCLKEIDCINEFLSSTEYPENSERLYSKVESIRDNYNKIIVNIQKMINSVPSLGEFKQKYLSSVLPKEKDLRTISHREDKSTISKLTPNKMMTTIGMKSQSNSKLNQDVLNKTTNPYSASNKNIVKDQWIEGINKDLNELDKIKLAKTYSEKESLSIKAFNNNTTNTNNSNKPEENKSQSLSGNNSKNKTKKKPLLNRPITPILSNQIKKPLNTTNIIQSSNQKIHNQGSSIKGNLIEREALSVLSEEIKHIKSYYDELNQTVRQHCLIANQKKEFEQMKKENIKLIADVSILKEDMMDLMKSYQKISNAVSALQLDNDNLKQQNKNLLAYIANNGDGSDNNGNEMIRQLDNNMCFNSNDMMFSNTIQDNNTNTNDKAMTNYNRTSEEISELSAFNSKVLGQNSTNYNKGRNNQNQALINTNATNLSELTKLNQTITNNSKNTTPICIKQRRFLIHKDQ